MQVFLIHAIPEILLQFPNAHLQIVGDGEDVPKLKNLIKKLNLEEKVELTGKVTNEELRLRYSSCDVYLSASNFEVCPVPTLEAMSCGKPLVLYDINPHREIIELSSAGVLFSKLNKKEISTQIKEVIENKEKYSNNAIIFAKEHDWKNISLQVAKIYEEIS